MYTVYLAGEFKYLLYVHPYLGRIPILTTIFQMGWKTTNQIFLDLIDSMGRRMECFNDMKMFSVWVSESQNMGANHLDLGKLNAKRMELPNREEFACKIPI